MFYIFHSSRIWVNFSICDLNMDLKDLKEVVLRHQAMAVSVNLKLPIPIVSPIEMVSD